ncbi:MAG: PA2778 family cysteine peptidase [Desulfobacteraceae bacterium]|jgi:tetratricopeptide (TPR) repeat protein
MIFSRNYLHFCGILLPVFYFGCFLIGCAGFRQMQMPPLPDNLPSAYELETVPFYPQKDYQCGPATLAMVLSYSGLTLQPEDLVDEVYTPSRKGSLQIAMIGAARRHGRLAYGISGLDSIFHEIAAGHPVIILQNLGLSWYTVWHYAVVVGYDAGEEMVILRSGTNSRKLMPFGVFEKTWARSNHWGLLILNPDELPAMAVEETFVTSVIGLEKARQFEAAIVGYHTALTRWPQSLAARMGLGNSYYAIGDLTNSEDAFREAVRLHPHAGAAYNNLAQVLLEQGRKHEALVAARRAVSIGGPLKTSYEETLREIEIEFEYKK